MKLKREEITLFTIAEEGLISTDNVGEGRMIPVLVLDTNKDNDFEDLLKLHLNITAGDTILHWQQKFFDRNIFILKIEFIKPMKITFGIEFNIDRDYSLIDGIIESKGVYLQTGVKGDKVSKKMDDPRILVEVPNMGVKEIWDEILLNSIKKKYMKKGYKKREAITISRQHISEMRKFWKMRR